MVAGEDHLLVINSAPRTALSLRGWSLWLTIDRTLPDESLLIFWT